MYKLNFIDRNVKMLTIVIAVKPKSESMYIAVANKELESIGNTIARMPIILDICLYDKGTYQ